jgi:hypothetical protein
MRFIKLFLISSITFLSVNLHAQTADQDANAFVGAALINDQTQVTAVYNFVKDIKDAGLWTKMKVIYPFVGGNDQSHSYNLKNPLTYRITWGGSVIHNATGITGNGTNAYGDSHFTLNNLYYRDPNNPNMDDMSWGWTIYNRSNNAHTTGMDFGNVDYDAGGIYARISQNFEANVGSNCTPLNASLLPASGSDASGLFVGINKYSDQLTEDKKIYRNGQQIASGSNSEFQWNTNYAYSITILAMNDNDWVGGIGNFSPNNLSLVAFHKALTAIERTAWEAAVNKFECALLRSVSGSCASVPPPSNPGPSQWTVAGNNIYNSNPGSVGIGTGPAHMGDPLYKLFVAKGIRTEKLKVDVPFESWPDYVFDKDYKLLRLVELEKYIKLNQHLPGIPSAKELEKDGLDVGKNQAMLLRKIEELSLIAIKQNKEIEKLKKQIKGYKK